MHCFVRFDRGDYERLACHDRWSAGEAASAYVNVKNEINGSFSNDYWREDAEKACFELLTDKFLVWRKEGRLVCYGPEGDLCPPLKSENEIMRPYGDCYGIDCEKVYFMKKQLLDVYEKNDAKATKRIRGLLEGKYWKEPRADITEEDLFKILATRVIEEFEDYDKTSTKDEVIKTITRVGVGSDYSKTTLYKWVGEVVPSKK